MSLVSKLREIDDRVYGRQPGAEEWDRAARLWWIGLIGLPLAVLGSLAYEGEPGLALSLWSVLAAFHAGFFYNERLRRTGSPPTFWWFRRPPGE